MDVMQTGLRSTRLVPTPTQASPHPGILNNHEVVNFSQQSYPLMSIVQPELQCKKTRSSFISTHLRSLVSLGFLLMLGLSLIGTNTLGGGTLQNIIHRITLLSQSQPIDISNISLEPHSTFPTDASQQLTRISQLDPNEYASNAEYSTWAYSACSTASMTEVFDSYGYHYRITDVLRIEFSDRRDYSRSGTG